MARLWEDDLTIHILMHGISYCGMEGVPRDWPKGHKWVSKADRRDANCPGCQAIACNTCGNPLADTTCSNPQCGSRGLAATPDPADRRPPKTGAWVGFPPVR